jgi:flagellar basal body rod protein FlgC
MFTYSISGIQASLNLMEKAAYEASRGPKGDLVKSQVDMIIARHSLGANVAALKTANEMYKTLIDILI